MKKLVIGAAALACASIVTAQTVTSANIVGYNKVTAVKDLNFFGAPFSDGTNSLLVSEVLGDGLPIGSTVFSYNGGYSQSKYEEQTRLIPGTIPPQFEVIGTNWAPDVELDLAAGYIVTIPDEAPEASYDGIASGEVLLDDSFSTDISAGLNLLANPYPVTQTVTNMGFTGASVGDTIFTYDGGYSQCVYEEITRLIPGTIPPQFEVIGTNWNPQTVVIGVGEAFWYDSAGNFEWTAPRIFDVD